MVFVYRDILTRFLPAQSWTQLWFRTVPASFHVAMEIANYSWELLCMPRTNTLEKKKKKKDELHSLLTYEKSLSIDYTFFFCTKKEGKQPI